jgi:rare lipoprotein A
MVERGIARKLALLLFFLFVLSSCARPPRPYRTSAVPGWLKPYRVDGKVYYPLPSAQGYQEVCYASWYGPGFHGKFAASGEVYNMYDYTAAHRILPMGTYVLVKNLENGKEVVVRINDRGPFVKGRCIDLSYAAAKALGMIGKGVVKVKIIALGEGKRVKNYIVYKKVPSIRFNEFYLQVGAFKIFKNALALKLKLETRFPRVRIETYKRGQETFYRVQIFLSNDLKKAYAMAERLKSLFPQGFLVAK